MGNSEHDEEFNEIAWKMFDEDFPEPNAERAGEIYTAMNGVIFQCMYVEEVAEWSWVPLTDRPAE